MERTKFLPVAIALATLLILSAGLGAAQGPAPQGQGRPQVMLGPAFTYQGQLQKDGTLVDDTCTMVFSLYDDATAGSRVGDPITSTVPVADGLFTVLLNTGGEFGLAAFNGAARWLEIAVQCPGDTGFNTLAPRQVLTAAPYALSLRPGATTDGLVEGGSAFVAVNRADYSYGVWGQSDAYHDAVGVRGLASSYDGGGTGVWGEARTTDGGVGVRGEASGISGINYGVYGVADSQDGYGVYGTASYAGVGGQGDTYGVYGLSAAIFGHGVYGKASATFGANYGVYGLSASNSGGRGVYGEASATSGTAYGVQGVAAAPDGRGVYGLASAGTGHTYGVVGQVNSSDGKGVYGYASSTGPGGSAYGVYGEVAGTGIGTYGYASATSGLAHGVMGRSKSSEGFGVWGMAEATTGAAYGVAGWTSSPEGAGVYGATGSTTGSGVYGQSTATTGAVYGVYATGNSPQGAGVIGITAAEGDGWPGPAGVYGLASAATGCCTYGVHGESAVDAGVGVYGYAPSGTGVEGKTGDPDNRYGVFYIGGIGGIGLKTSIVETQDYGWRKLYSMESADVWFEDVGTAQLVNGEAVVTIDLILAQTVNLNESYHVFLTPLGNCALYVADKTTASFTVRALGDQACSIAFDYRIIAKRLGYEVVRLTPAADPTLMDETMPPPASPQGQP